MPAFKGDCECESEYFLSLLPGGVTVMVVTAYMVDYVQVNRTLQNLNLESNQLGPKGAVPLAEALKVRQTAHLHMSLHHFSLFVS